MGDIINLRRARKAKQRDDETRAAEAARLASGRTKVEKLQTKALRALDDKRIDGHRRETSDRRADD
ncbi:MULTISPECIES: DUF4169 family protein [unclassified Beijerinckia]|uniref:DUF4169 family protein n=1 Tax=unclassified Beijerinckia TaxID=2638183 RepID=UPI0008982388|nr:MULTISPECIES: DUF4169 family protein [unclassified Beijerinckia]MDH7799639.1 hypothetical protein [Beijerinckia sp. GAS462]SEB48400.1 protein of unknown function [Beijerinckia sp. 28-YEA-48]